MAREIKRNKAIVRESTILSQKFARDLEKKTFALYITTMMHKKKMRDIDLAGSVGCTERAIKFYRDGERVPGLSICGEIFKSLGVTSDDYVIFKRMVQAHLDIF